MTGNSKARRPGRDARASEVVRLDGSNGSEFRTESLLVQRLQRGFGLSPNLAITVADLMREPDQRLRPSTRRRLEAMGLIEPLPDLFNLSATGGLTPRFWAEAGDLVEEAQHG